MGTNPTSGSSAPSKTPSGGSAGQKPSEIRFLGDLQRLEFKRGDRFVVTVQGQISQEEAQVMQKQWREFIGGAEGIPLLILHNGATIGIISAEAA